MYNNKTIDNSNYTVYLWPPSNKMSRYFDEYYLELMKDINFEILELNHAVPVPFFLFKHLITFSFFRKNILKYYLRNKKFIIHFTSQLHVYSDITDNFLFTFHDVLHLNSGSSGSDTPDVTCLNIVDSVKFAKKIITISRYSKDKIALYYNCNPDRIEIISNGVNLSGKSERKSKKSLIFVGTNAPRKNLVSFLEAVKYYQLIYDSSISVIVVSNLSIDNLDKSYARIINQLSINNLTLLNNISPEHLTKLYKNEGILISPSHDEGFGLPPLEAQSFGMPIIVSDIPVFREVYGDSVVYCNPNSYQDIATKIHKLFSDESVRKCFVEKSYLNASKYSYKTAANKTINIYKELLYA